MILDYYLVYQFIRRLATPFREWDAYKLGIIDDNGFFLKKRRTLTTSEERRAFGAYDVMILNLKKMLEKLPGGKSRLASYAAALFLLREWNHFTPNSMLTESVSDSNIEKTVELFFNGYTDYILSEESVNQKMHTLDTLFEQKFVEDVPTNNVGSGNISGLGIGPDGEPGITKRQQARHRRKNRILRRLAPTFVEDLDAYPAKRTYVSPKMSRPKYKKHVITTKPAIADTTRSDTQ
jgi:hypothetical protein